MSDLRQHSPTDEQLAALTQCDEIDRVGGYVSHAAYVEINRQVRSGRPWAKCVWCGLPYPLDREGASSTFCSVKHEERKLAALADDVRRSR